MASPFPQTGVSGRGLLRLDKGMASSAQGAGVDLVKAGLVAKNPHPVGGGEGILTPEAWAAGCPRADGRSAAALPRPSRARPSGYRRRSIRPIGARPG